MSAWLQGRPIGKVSVGCVAAMKKKREEFDLNLMAPSIVERAIGPPLIPKVETDKGITIAKISRLPDGRFVLSTEPDSALSEGELRKELKLKHPLAIVEDIIRRVKQKLG
jgi:hypothetical protein